MKTLSTMFGLNAALLSIVPLASAQYYTCSPQGFNEPEWMCDLCGDYDLGSSPLRCGPYNATVCLRRSLLFC